MDYARHYVEANRIVEGVAQREHWEASARGGSAVARAQLNAPPFPEELDYLWEWAWALHGRSGAHMGGMAPLSYGTIADWSRLTGTVIDPLEVEALIQLDGALIGSSGTAEADKPEPKPTPAWPEKKANA